MVFYEKHLGSSVSFTTYSVCNLKQCALILLTLILYKVSKQLLKVEKCRSNSMS